MNANDQSAVEAFVRAFIWPASAGKRPVGWAAGFTANRGVIRPNRFLHPGTDGVARLVKPSV